MLEDILEKIREYKLIAGLTLVILTLLMVCGFLVVNGSQKEPESTLPSWSKEMSSDTDTAISSEEVKKKQAKERDTDVITVDVKGAVKKPGVYQLPDKSRVNEAVLLAGGVTEEADRKSVNFAQKLTDEAVIYVASQGENITVVPKDPAVLANEPGASSVSDKINLNTATLTDLQTISGIGQKRAQDILDYRDSSGGFKSVEDLVNVSGIGEKTLEKLREEVTVD